MKESIKKGFRVYLIFVVIAVIMYIPYGFWGLNRALALYLWMLASIIYGIYCLYVYAAHTKNNRMINLLSIALVSLLVFYGVRYYNYKEGQKVALDMVMQEKQDFSQATTLNINETVLIPAESGGMQHKFIINVPKDGDLIVKLEHEYTKTALRMHIMDASKSYIYQDWGLKARISGVKSGEIYYLTLLRAASFIEYSVATEVED